MMEDGFIPVHEGLTSCVKLSGPEMLNPCRPFDGPGIPVEGKSRCELRLGQIAPFKRLPNVRRIFGIKQPDVNFNTSINWRPGY